MRAFYPLFIGLFKLFLKSRRKHDLHNKKLSCKIRAVSPDVADPNGLQRARQTQAKVKAVCKTDRPKQSRRKIGARGEGLRPQLSGLKFGHPNGLRIIGA